MPECNNPALMRPAGITGVSNCCGRRNVRPLLLIFLSFQIIGSVRLTLSWEHPRRVHTLLPTTPMVLSLSTPTHVPLVYLAYLALHRSHRIRSPKAVFGTLDLLCVEPGRFVASTYHLRASTSINGESSPPPSTFYPKYSSCLRYYPSLISKTAGLRRRASKASR
jgi:hypothetical protein